MLRFRPKEVAIDNSNARLGYCSNKTTALPGGRQLLIVVVLFVYSPDAFLRRGRLAFFAAVRCFFAAISMGTMSGVSLPS